MAMVKSKNLCLIICTNCGQSGRKTAWNARQKKERLYENLCEFYVKVVKAYALKEGKN